VLSLAAAWLGQGCTAPAPPAPVSHTPPLSAASHTVFGRGVETLSSAAQGVQFPLPGTGWTSQDSVRGGLVALHAETFSRLSIRGFRDAELGRGESCEAQARAADPAMPTLDGDVIERRRLSLAPDFELALSVTIAGEPAARGASGPLLYGYAFAFGGDGRRCLAIRFSTIVHGEHAEAVVAERLGLIVESTFARMRLRSIDERVTTPRL
jgi:hypothetical protein